MTEMAEVGVQRFSAGDGKKDGAQNDQATARVFGEKADRVGWHHRSDDRGVAQDAVESQDRDHKEPHQHDGSEDRSHTRGATALEHEQADQDDERNPQDPMLQGRLGDLEALDRRQHGDRRRECAIGIQQRRSEDA